MIVRFGDTIVNLDNLTWAKIDSGEEPDYNPSICLAFVGDAGDGLWSAILTGDEARQAIEFFTHPESDNG